MNRKKLGKTGLNVAPIAFGGNVFGWTLDAQASIRMLDDLADSGLNFIDTADVYSAWAPGNSGGESERILGKWFKQSGKRDRTVLATKVGLPLPGSAGGLKADYIVKSVEDSLQRLNTDYIDLYQAHKDDPTTPLEETLGAFDKLVKAGKVRAIGASNYSAARLKEALAVSEANNLAAFATMQPLYNLCDRKEFEEDLAQSCLDNGIAVINFYSLANGFLTGKYRTEDDFKEGARASRAKPYLNPRGLRILEALDSVADEYHVTPASVSVAWLMSQPAITAPIVSATSERQLAALIEAARLELSPQALASLDQASAY